MTTDTAIDGWTAETLTPDVRRNLEYVLLQDKWPLHFRCVKYDWPSDDVAKMRRRERARLKAEAQFILWDYT